MTDEKKDDSTETKPETPRAKAAPVQIHTQYVKDLSFENPNAPDTLRAGQGGQTGPQMDININLDARPIEDKDIKSLYEVVLTLSATAKRDKTTVFLAELQYGIVASLENVPEDQHHPVLLIEVPRMAFPFARQILADATAAGGYPPLLLNPVDFHAMYLDRFKDELETAQKEKAG